MLAIRMQRTGRTGHAQFRVIVQDSRAHPKRGKVVAYVGNYDPHSKTVQLDSEKINAYLKNGAQPSDTVAKLLQKEGVKLPDWFKASRPKAKSVRNPEKRRSTRPAGAPEPEPKTPPVEEAPAEEFTETSEVHVEEPAAEETAPEPEKPVEGTPAETEGPKTEEPPAEPEK